MFNVHVQQRSGQHFNIIADCSTACSTRARFRCFSISQHLRAHVRKGSK